MTELADAYGTKFVQAKHIVKTTVEEDLIAACRR
jgi:hypothetical protein